MNMVYIAGPYTSPNGHDHKGYHDIEENISQARRAAAQLAVRGIPYFCPHMHSAHFEVITPEVPPQFWYELNMGFLAMCRTIWLLPGWSKSNGTLAELEFAAKTGMTICMSIEEVECWWQSVRSSTLLAA